MKDYDSYNHSMQQIVDKFDHADAQTITQRGKMKYNLEGKIFRSIANTKNGDVVSAEYEGGAIFEGHLLAKVMSDGA